ncbi:aminotransferase class I/II-fold pyridoxal phosphate-dependent enzyme [Streptomyces sp. P9(2023)]|uniref:aminotransferase class I/II-fold pyridoxal phosphate-dependent enzyme n=1 Tax=Streptomyces sp. P9(2023) TaxID=3064394 RepID=UPI0028F3FD64|nr:aminotransferase class I/II-fold pyridoxal phosphate-dependent enzyme [Streptomyces sp. P9(2023)]MDT9687041.1 aminotransferase class I/II-fold pyridoxal phosphate-dependent enzyme [Streptomyces sp. P9(2023)]
MQQARSAFARLRALQDGVPTPPGLTPVRLHLGESRLPSSGIDDLALLATGGWSRYPPLGGTEELRAAYRDWLERRFGVREALARGTVAVEPTPGTKQAVALALARAVGRAGAAGASGVSGEAGGRVGGGRGGCAVVMPNPFYPTYHAATLAAGARPVFYDPDRGAAAVEEAVAAAGVPVAALIVCNPGNPRGDLLSEAFLRDAAAAARAADALFVVDECYTDLSFGRTPTGYLALVERSEAANGRFLVLHTLSKRSGAPGLRSGFAAGDAETVADYAYHNRVCGVSTPLPVCSIAARLWRDDEHVELTRQALARNWELADEILADVPHYRRAEAGFFLWLPVDDDEATALRLWRDHALSVMPGRYFGAVGHDGVNPGAGHVRIALVHEEPLMREALLRLRDGMTTGVRTAALLPSASASASHRPPILQTKDTSR